MINLHYLFFDKNACLLQGIAGFFTDRETRSDVWMRLVNPTLDWGPAMPDDWRRYSAKRGNPEDDDVFSPAELVAIKAVDDKDRLVKFKDEQKTQAEVNAVNKEDEPKEEEPQDKAAGDDEKEKLVKEDKSEDKEQAKSEGEAKDDEAAV